MKTKDINSLKKITAPLLAITTVIFTVSVAPYNEYWFIPILNENVLNLVIYFVLIVLVPIIGLIIIPNYLKNSLSKFKNHIMTNALIEKDWYNIIIVFTCTMIFEELIFRGLILVSLFSIFEISQIGSIILSSVIFSLYHLHTWPTFHDKKITIVFMLFSLVLGLICGYFLFLFGYVSCILFHWLSVILIYTRIVKKI